VEDFNASVGKISIPDAVGTNTRKENNYNGNFLRDFSRYNN
jgi:hypothetical protein